MRKGDKLCVTLAAVFLLGSLIFWQQADSAQGQQSSDAALKPMTESGNVTYFRTVEGPVRDQIPGGLLLLAAYGLVWLLLLLYVAHVGRLQTQAQRELDRLEQWLSKAGASDQTGGETKPENRELE